MQMKTSILPWILWPGVKSMNKSKKAGTPTTRSSFKQKSKQKIHFCSFIAPFHRMLSRIVSKSCKRRPLGDETLSLRQNV